MDGSTAGCKHDKGGTHLGTDPRVREGDEGSAASWPVHSRSGKPGLWTSYRLQLAPVPEAPHQQCNLLSGDVRRFPRRSKPSRLLRPTIPDSRSPPFPIRISRLFPTLTRLRLAFLFPAATSDDLRSSLVCPITVLSH